MKKKILFITLTITTGIISFILIQNKPIKKLETSLEDNSDIKTELVDLTIGSIIDELLDNMTIEQKIAQMLIISYNKDEVDEGLLRTLENNPYGGIILTRDNITTISKTRQFVTDLQNNSSIPLIISVDQEGGSVERLKYLQDITATTIPYMYDLGSTNNSELAYKVGELMAEEMRTIGINVDFAPVLDIYSNLNNTVIGKRSFSSDKDIVSKMALNLARGLEDNGVIATYKHFPGHGDTATDSHQSLPIINKTYEELKNLELIPFQAATNNNAKMMMIGHIALPSITGDTTPASLSSHIITSILKKDMGYDGLIITDALNMGALTNNYTDEEIYIKALEAGVDLLLMPRNPEAAISIIKNNFSEERINESVKKILTFKYTELIDATSFLDSIYLGSEEHQAIISQIPEID